MLGIYIHIPFCKRICSYCDFCKILYNDKYVYKYLDNLELEIKSRYNFEKVKTIYIGGGSPSSLSNSELEKLLSIMSIFNLSSDYEYTIECNPREIDIDKINIFKSYGINRISVGVESFDKNIGKILNRDNDEEMVFDKITLLKKYFDNINIDLIYGVNSNIDIVKKDIKNFLELDIPHISCYSLIIEEHTKLYIDNHKYIDEDIDYEMYEYIKNTLNKNGYVHYEISNYAKDGYESVHNLNYWHNGKYLGFGLSAVSYINNMRISNTKNISKYLSGNYVDNSKYEDINMRRENDLILGFRLVNGISITEFNKKYHDDLLSKDVIKELLNDGYLEIIGDNIRCHEEYLYMENIILEKIIDSDL